MKRIIGLRVREARKAAGLTQGVVDERLGCTVESISNLERGKSLPSLEGLAAIARELGLRLPDLLSGIEADSPDREQLELESRAMAAIRMLDKTRLRIAVKQLEALQEGIEDSTRRKRPLRREVPHQRAGRGSP